ncbi:MAG: RluA family pseudouridine synthase [Tissierellaceae bacterium]
MVDYIELYVDGEDEDRLDTYLSKKLDEVSRTYIQKMIRDGSVLVNGDKKKPRYLLKEGDYIQVDFPKPKVLEIQPEDIDIDIIYEDEDIAIVNKSVGMVVHPASGNIRGTLVNALLYHLDSLSSFNEAFRPGIVHRLDKDTSGLMVIAKNNDAHRFLAEKLVNRDFKREYIALVHGSIDREYGLIDAPIGRDQRDRRRMTVTEKNSKEAITEYSVLQKFKDYTLIQARLQTGRMHQIRVHFQYIGHPVVGDPVYSFKKDEFGLKTQLLHAIRIGFVHPRTGEYIEFETQIPTRFTDIMNRLQI